MTTKKIAILSIVGIVVVVGAAVALLAGQGGGLLQGYLNFPKPIYDKCELSDSSGKKIEIDCNEFDKERTSLPDGDYSLKLTYTNEALGENGESTVPFKLKSGESTCTFIENGYQPKILISADSTAIVSEKEITEPTEYSLGENAILIQINYLKDGKTSAFDQHLCGNGIEGTVYDTSKNELGIVKLNRNGFINTTNIINQLRIVPNAFHYGSNIKPKTTGNFYLSLNIYPELLFTYNLPCSVNYPQLKLLDIETSEKNKPIVFDIKDIPADWAAICSDKIYLSFLQEDGENTKLNANLKGVNGVYTASINPSEIGALQRPTTVYPVTGDIGMFFRDDVSSNKVYTLGKFKLTVNGTNTATPTTPGSTSQNLPIPTLINNQESTGEVSNKVRVSDQNRPPEPTNITLPGLTELSGDTDTSSTDTTTDNTSGLPLPIPPDTTSTEPSSTPATGDTGTTNDSTSTDTSTTDTSSGTSDSPTTDSPTTDTPAE